MSNFNKINLQNKEKDCSIHSKQEGYQVQSIFFIIRGWAISKAVRPQAKANWYGFHLPHGDNWQLIFGKWDERICQGVEEPPAYFLISLLDQCQSLCVKYVQCSSFPMIVCLVKFLVAKSYQKPWKEAFYGLIFLFAICSFSTVSLQTFPCK